MCDCLYDFVKWYDIYNGNDSNDQRIYKIIIKPRLPNHRVYDPSKENEKEDYFYSLLLLFHPFRNESDLIAKDQTTEEAINQFIASNSDIQQHHEKLSKILQAQQKLMSIVTPQKN